MQQKDALTVLLTGRNQTRFADLIKRMVKSKELDFDMLCLRPAMGPENQSFSSTMFFKQELLKDLALTYGQADEVKMYEDRPKQYVSRA